MFEIALIQIKALSALVGRLSLSVGWENGPERELKTVTLFILKGVLKSEKKNRILFYLRVVTLVILQNRF